MLNVIIGFSIRNKLIIGLGVVALIAIGLYNLSRLPIDAVPDITNNQVMVITTSPSLGAADIERMITFPVEMATKNIPGMVEQRSFSRFGLSLITLVFTDQTDIYWARQQVAERLIQVQREIPVTLGTPTLGPVTTGLGEIFQYVVRPAKGYESKYNAFELRTIQDWLIRKKLLGTPGVADVSSFGGLLKQYEVTIDPQRLKAQGVTINQLLTALQQNNQNTGGAYIEKGPTVLYIRSEGLLKSPEDIAAIPVKILPNGTPLHIRDVATVNIGSAVRYGAMCYNQQGEVAGGVVMMLKGGNSSEVVRSVKFKIAEIQQTLPDGVIIEPFLDRTKMVDNAIKTVAQNLMEGALIVIFVLVLFLGNLRAGLLVASVIPLSLLFAISLMRWFGVSGNLMSLGALDFGLIVDGAVIIVEAVMHRLYQQKQENTAADMNATVASAAGKMMNTAVFGQMIILIVYLPILVLEGIEGKMFRPMAETVAFAIIGAFFLSVTYVPMMASWVLRASGQHQPTWADRQMQQIEGWYGKALKRLLHRPAIVLSVAIVLFAFSFLILSQLGGEFIPKLEEGDFAVDTRVLPGSSLKTTISATQQASQILLERFPEVEKVVTKIGSGEIPTDPMPMEASDMMVILKPKKNWVSATSFDELAGKMNEALQEIPGITTGFQFPVQMRFNELMTGGRQDIVCKIYGDNLDTLSKYANTLSSIIQKIPGACDVYEEQVTGLPQLIINYKREALAQYGLSIGAANEVITAAMAGASAGQVYEGEKRFDLVVRLQDAQHRTLADIRELPVLTSTGQQIPLEQIADIQVMVGPNQIQREEAQRRITVGFNVRGADVRTVVERLQQHANIYLKLPPGYNISYGGQFENLIAAEKRLRLSLPVALLLIFTLLFFAFNSIPQSMLIFSAIPLSAIGGILTLWLRGMPFSISAAVGFIALFGVAVLNGIVLIAEFNVLKQDGIDDINERILKGTQTRLRPVLMTAAVASLGFLPMALSTGAGAEVQRPLASVVIGGLLTATLLTLAVLPVLYRWLENRKSKSDRTVITMMIASFLMLSSGNLRAQIPISLPAATDSALHNNRGLLAENAKVAGWRWHEKTAWDIPNTNTQVEYGQINSIYNDTKFSINQNMALPVLYTSQHALYTTQTKVAEAERHQIERILKRQVAGTFYDIAFLREKRKLLQLSDSLYQLFAGSQVKRFALGDADILEKTAAQSASRQAAMQRHQLESDYQTLIIHFRQLLQTPQDYEPAEIALKYPLEEFRDSFNAFTHPATLLLQQQAAAARKNIAVNKWQMLPQLTLGYSNQSINGFMKTGTGETFFSNTNRFQSAQLGMAVPIFFQTGKARVQLAKQQYQQAQLLSEQTSLKAKADWQETRLRISNYKMLMDEYEKNLLPQADELISGVTEKLKQGAINYMEWMLLINQSIQLKTDYLNTVQQYNQAVLDLIINY